MNKLFAIAFMCIYLLLSVGVVKTTHYCMGREKSTELFSFQAKKCPCSLFLTENGDFCKDEHEVLSIQDSHSFSPVFTLAIPEFSSIGEIFRKDDFFIFEQSLTQVVVDQFSPPPKEPLYKINCSLILYDDEWSA
jgi:hypothetical protein